MKKDSVMYVTGFDKKEANYFIHEDKERVGGYVIAYEKVENNCVKFEGNENKNQNDRTK